MSNFMRLVIDWHPPTNIDELFKKDKLDNNNSEKEKLDIESDDNENAEEINKMQRG